MKTIKYFIAALLVCLRLPAFALDDPQNGFGVGSTNFNVNPSWAIIPARSANGGAPAVNFIAAGSDLAGAVVSFYKVTAQTVARYSTNVTVTLSVDRTNGFASGTVIIIQHLANDSYEKKILTTMTASTNLITTVAPAGTVSPGDIIYAVSTSSAPSIAWGATTNTISAAAPIVVGQRGKPLLVEINSTSAGQLRAVGGTYLP